MQKLRQLNGCRGEFNALDFVIDERTYTIADPTAIQPRIISLLRYQVIFAPKYFYVDFINGFGI